MIAESNTPIDVFISRKSEDAALAKQLYNFLTEKGLRTFDSDEALPKMGNTDYLEQIDKALENCLHMVVLGSSIEHIQSRWVKKEWSSFINEKLSGRKNGNLLTIITDGLLIQDLPLSLRNYQVIFFDKKNFENVAAYLVPEKPSVNTSIIERPLLHSIETPDPVQLMKLAKEKHTTDYGSHGNNTSSISESKTLDTSFGKFTLNGNGTITDHKNRLMWIQAPWGMVWNGAFFSGKPISINWFDAVKLFGKGAPVYISPEENREIGDGALPPELMNRSSLQSHYTKGSCTVNFAGFTDWRLPTSEDYYNTINNSTENNRNEKWVVDKEIWGNLDPNSVFYNVHFWNGFFWTANERKYNSWLEKIGLDHKVAWKAAPGRKFVTDDRKELEYFILFVRNI